MREERIDPLVGAVLPALGRPASASDEALRDLMGLLALPALWVGRDAATVLQLTTEAVNSIVSTAVCLVRAPLAPGAVPATLLYVGGVRVEAEASWSLFMQACMKMEEGAEDPVGVGSPLGTLRVVRLYLGPAGRFGSLWFGSSRADFPSLHQGAFMRAAATLAGTGLHAARLDQERERAARAKDEFLAMLGHELRNPLAPISTALHLIKLRNDGLEREHQIIERQVGHLSKLVDDLLDITRITRGKVELIRKPIAVDALLTEAIEGVSPLLEERQQLLRTHCAVPPDIQLMGDPGRLRQVLVNLLSNAAKYTPPHGEVGIRAETMVNGDVLIEVYDNGAGIDGELLPRIFELFEQGSTTLDRAKGGLGIGLAIVKQLVDLHGGRVEARSDGVGQGARFLVMLPAVARAVDSAAAAQPVELLRQEDRQRRILVVDDNRDAAETLGMALRYSGYEVVTTTLPQEVMSLVQGQVFDVAVLDIGMPVIDGYELASQIRADMVEGAPRLIALTGYGQSSDRDKALASGFDEHMVKPIDLDLLLKTLENLTRRQSNLESL
ncbi:His Kinase A (phospho-acceptor) domain-containing protein [Roseateles sp. YR242]|uniref:hybrid sensor histidine kinase/response regulator n=1 Tax=Roseateles sp. YR242 TaxID=1855305 RepID=UPI0008B797FE|nr:ATP-binding protein [Roseateles sp. YR242]SEL06331.1 His Kinase A (phospho-acceptor) domain-containing protein [Roseateles sp. YR242]